MKRDQNCMHHKQCGKKKRKQIVFNTLARIHCKIETSEEDSNSICLKTMWKLSRELSHSNTQNERIYWHLFENLVHNKSF